MLIKTPDEFENPTIFDSGEENDIIETLSKRLGYDKKIIEGTSRLQEIVKVRDLIAYLLREYGALSYPAIGRLLGNRDHTTIMHAYKKVRHNIEVYPELKIELKDLIQEVEIIKERKLRVEHDLIPEILAYVKASKINQIHQVFKKIPERNLKTLELWREGLTLRNIANVFNVTRERVRQIVIATIKQVAINESVSRGIVMDSNLLIEEESKKRRVLQESKKEKVVPIKKEKHWSRFYTACRLCGTTAMPHMRHGLCEKCSGQYRSKRRKDIIQRHSNGCDKCGISQSEAIRKYGRDFYINKSQQVLCQGCFLKIAGEKLGSRIRRPKTRV